MLEEKFNIDGLKRNEAVNFIAEVFYEELKFILGQDLDDILKVKHYGMNSRVSSKDVLDVTTQYQAIVDKHKEFLVLHLSRSSIYHHLPEILFHPLVVSSPSMSNREIVEAIKENKRREDRNLQFFLPFDTEIFKERAKIVNRHLNYLTDDNAKKSLLYIAENIVDAKLDITKDKLILLFFNLCEVERLKENFQEIERLIKEVLGLDIKMKYKTKVFEEVPFKRLGEGRLGIDFGLCGKTESELDNIEVTINLEKTIEYQEILKNNDNIKAVLNFLIIAGRDIIISYNFKKTPYFILGNGILGYDTYVKKGN